MLPAVPRRGPAKKPVREALPCPVTYFCEVLQKVGGYRFQCCRLCSVKWLESALERLWHRNLQSLALVSLVAAASRTQFSAFATIELDFSSIAGGLPR